jgi:hypothetical protein
LVTRSIELLAAWTSSELGWITAAVHRRCGRVAGMTMMLLKFSGCELELNRSRVYANVPRFGELYANRTSDNRGSRWLECVREGNSVQFHLGSTLIILCRPYKPANGLDGLSAA